MDLVVRILNKIKESKQLQRPVLGYPILTYIVSPRVRALYWSEPTTGTGY